MKEFSAESGVAIADQVEPQDGTEMKVVQLLDIEPSLTNPRKHFDPVKLGELADSIRASGVHQPVLLRPLPGSRVPETFGFRRQGSPLPVYELIAGERRFRASKIAGAVTIPAMIRPLTDEQVLEIQIVENLQRDDLTELEEAEGYEALIQASGMTAEAVGGKIGKSRSYVYARLKLTALCFDARKALREGKIDASKGLLIARIPTEALQLKALEEISALGYDDEPRYSYREAAAYIQRNYMLRLDSARFKITDATLVPEAGSCRECPMRTGHEPDLFVDVQSKDTCTNPPCFHTKDQVHQARMLQEASERGQTVISGREAKALMPYSFSPVTGYLRLDDVHDSPTDKPLRKLLSAQLKATDVQPTLLANPHKEGELIAVLPASTAAELLKAAGHADATASIEKHLKSDAESKARQETQDKKRAYEARWRWGVLEACWATLTRGSGLADVPVFRCAAEHYAALLNVDGAKRLCKLLGLGKVAPKEGIDQFLADSKDPTAVLMLLIAFHDVEYRHWITDREPNPRLLMIAQQCDVDVTNVKIATKDEIREEERAAAAKAEKASAATLLAAQPEGDGGKKPKGQKSTGGPAAPARKPKASAEETMSGIAAAMQELDETAANAAAAPAAAPAEDPALRQLGLAVGFAAGQRVRVTRDKDKLPGRVFKYLGKEGTIKNKVGDRAWMVTFRGRIGGVASFDESELEATPQEGVAA